MSNESVKPARYDFYCAKCGKNIQITWEMYTGYYEGHTLCLSCRPAEKAVEILTEEELQEIESTYGRFNPTLLRTIASIRSLNSRNLKLVLENDELMAENVKYKQAYNKLLKEINS